MCSVEDDLLLFSHRQVITHILGEGISRAPETILPKAGSRFKFKWHDRIFQKDWRADGYTWRQKAGKKSGDGGRFEILFQVAYC